MRRLLACVVVLALTAAFGARAAPFLLPQTIGPVELTEDTALIDAVVRATGAGPGVLGDLPDSPYVVGESVDDFLDFDFETEATLADDDFIELFFNGILYNGDGYDFVVFEVFDQSDAAGATLDWMVDPDDIVRVEATLITDGADMDGRHAYDVDGDGIIEDDEGVFIYGFDLSDFGFGMDEILAGSLFLSAGFAGAADIAHISAVNILMEVPEVPLPAALPLFLAGLAGFGLVRRRKG